MEADSLSVIVRTLSAELLRTASCYTCDRDEAEDLVQQTWALAFLRRRQLSREASMQAWVRKICRNVCITYAREQKRRQNLLRLAPYDALLSDHSQSTAPPVAHGAAIRSAINAVQGLSSERREALLLRIVHGLSDTEIAERMACPVGTVKSHLHRSVLALREAARACLWHSESGDCVNGVAEPSARPRSSAP